MKKMTFVTFFAFFILFLGSQVKADETIQYPPTPEQIKQVAEEVQALLAEHAEKMTKRQTQEANDVQMRVEVGIKELQAQLEKIKQLKVGLQKKNRSTEIQDKAIKETNNYIDLARQIPDEIRKKHIQEVENFKNENDQIYNIFSALNENNFDLAATLIRALELIIPTSAVHGVFRETKILEKLNDLMTINQPRLYHWSYWKDWLGGKKKE